MRFYSKLNALGVVEKVVILGNDSSAPRYFTEITEADYLNAVTILPLADVKFTALDYIDRVAGEVRTNFITDVPGQPQTYQMKLDDAIAFKAAGYTNLNSYVMMQAEVGAVTGDPVAICDGILATYEQWKNLSAIIERERRYGKIRVSACTTLAQVLDELDSAKTALLAIITG